MELSKNELAQIQNPPEIRMTYEIGHITSIKYRLIDIEISCLTTMRTVYIYRHLTIIPTTNTDWGG